ncbi:MAG: hypothetical protein K0R62_7822 [Nonomuraea muscovyensis]|nr:hypothetical protein [Nonomuraea muscovyensis]
MERIVEEREVDGHRVVIVEALTEEGSGYVVVVDDVLVNETEPLGRIPSDDDVRALVRMRGA